MFRLFFSGKACRLLVRQEKRALNIQVSFYGKSALLSYAKKAAKNPGAARLKNMNSSANNWRICVFLRVTPMAPEPSLRPKSRACARLAPARACGRRTAKLWRFSNAHETVRITFARSHAARVPENGIWNRGGPPRACRCRGNYFCAAAFPHARGAKHKPVCGPEPLLRPAAAFTAPGPLHMQAGPAVRLAAGPLTRTAAACAALRPPACPAARPAP